MGWTELLFAAGQHGIKMAANQIRKQQPASLSNPFKGSRDDCPACSIHREMAEARGLLEGVLRNWGPEPAPPERRAVVELVHTILELAPRKLELKGEHPEVEAVLQELRGCLREALARLPDRHNLNRGDWERALTAVTRCWELADDFAGAYFKPRPRPLDHEDPALAEKIRQLTPEDRARLHQILDG